MGIPIAATVMNLGKDERLRPFFLGLIRLRKRGRNRRADQTLRKELNEFSPLHHDREWKMEN
jgi:hypothetical protein